MMTPVGVTRFYRRSNVFNTDHLPSIIDPSCPTIDCSFCRLDVDGASAAVQSGVLIGPIVESSCNLAGGIHVIGISPGSERCDGVTVMLPSLSLAGCLELSTRQSSNGGCCPKGRHAIVVAI